MSSKVILLKSDIPVTLGFHPPKPNPLMNKIIAPLLLLCLALGSCKKDNSSTNSGCGTRPVVIVDASFDFTQPVTLHSCTTYYFNWASQYSIKSTLTIEAGAILKFPNTGTPFILSTSASGKIISNGTKDNPVIFTSDKDDAHGGDTNGDGTATTAAAGDWSYIVIDGLGSAFYYTQFLYNGSGNDAALFEITATGTVFDHCTFAHCLGSSSIAGRGVLSYSNGVASAPVTNCVFYDNVKPWTISDIISVDSSNVFHNPANPTQKNTYNAIFVEAGCCGTPPTLTWLENEVPFVYYAYYHSQSLNASSNAPVTLTVGPGVILKFVSSGTDYGPGISIRSDNSQIAGKDLPGVFFTSYKDDAHGGDTNADGTATSPASGDWDGVYDEAALVNPPSHYYTWSNILYAAN